MALTKITSRILDSSGVTILGTIATGVWQGTAINQTYLVGQSGTNTGDETLARINALDITELGTISSGVWNGTAINQTYLVGQSGTNTGDETLARINALDVTELGTISSGVWNGTVIASAYLDADTAHLSTTQTFTGAKTFSSGGIFSSSSQGKLKLVAGSNEYLSLEFANASGTTQWEISKNNTHDLYFYKGGYRMMLKADGNVGIGTTSPGASKLTVSDGVAGYSTANILLQVKRNATNSNDDTSKASIMLANNSNGFQIAYGGATDRLRFIDGGSNERLTLLNGGNLGIGTTSPAYLLTASGTNLPYIASVTASVQTVMASDQTNLRAYIGTRTNHPIAFVVDGNEKMRISSGGDVIQSSGNLIIKNAAGDSNGLKLFQDVSDVSVIENHYSGSMKFNIAGSTKLTISSGGVTASTLTTSGTNIFTGSTPLTFHKTGSDTYTKTVVYDAQNNTTDNAFSGITIEMAKLTNSNSAAMRNFTISSRGATEKYSFSRHGLSFNQTTASASNSLDAYEEGTWISEFRNVTAVYSANTSTYTRIGNVVYFIIFISTTSLDTTDTSQIQILLPFTAATGNLKHSPVTCFAESTWNIPNNGAGNIVPLVVPGTNNLDFYVLNSSTGANYTTLTYTNLGQAAVVRLSGFYYV